HGQAPHLSRRLIGTMAALWIYGDIMKHRISALFLGTALALAAGGGAMAQDKNIKIGVLTDNSGLYSDLGGAGSTLAAQMAIEDSGLAAKGWKIDLISADHQNKPDIATNIARQWIDVDKVDIFMDVLNSGVAQAAKAKIVGLANAGGDTTNSIKQAAEFGIVKGGQRLAGLLLFITDVHSLGLNVAQGLNFTETFYWDLNDDTRKFGKRFSDRA